MQNLIINVISTLNFGIKQKKSKIKVLNSKIVRALLKLFIQEGFIWGYSHLNKTYLLVILKKISQFSTWLNIQNYKLNTKNKYISWLNLKKIIQINPTTLFILSTKNGFLNQKQTLKKKIGGKLLCKIN